ncbi:MAG: DUF2335 domain-containing protein [Desulfovibrionaceae bacterium]|nr:DUF2335 domain-containing protein [Desulfovibrionaceae bacterium]
MGKNKRKKPYLPSQHKPQTSAEVKLSATKATVSVSPIPSAEELASYDKIRPGLLELIINDWQENSKCRRTTTEKGMRAKERALFLDSVKTAAVVFFMLGLLSLAAYLAFNGEYELASAVVLSPLLIGIIDALKQNH